MNMTEIQQKNWHGNKGQIQHKIKLFFQSIERNVPLQHISKTHISVMLLPLFRWFLSIFLLLFFYQLCVIRGNVKMLTGLNPKIQKLIFAFKKPMKDCNDFMSYYITIYNFISVNFFTSFCEVYGKCQLSVICLVRPQSDHNQNHTVP